MKKLHPIPTKFDINSVRKLGEIIDDGYYSYKGLRVPRVTKILSTCIHNDSLMYWANSLGFKRMGYKETLNHAAEYGTLVHELLERYIKGEDLPVDVPWNPIHSFDRWWKELVASNRVKVLGQEFSLTCPWYGGTYDMLLEINEQPWLVDFKTSNHIRVNYCLQLAAYRNMLRFNNIVSDIAGIIVLRFHKDKPEYEEFVLDLIDPRHRMFMDQCSATFNAMAYQYWNMVDIERQFKQLHRESQRR